MKKFTIVLSLFIVLGLKAQNVAQVPYHCDFEDSASIVGWVFANGTQQSQWWIGPAVGDMPSGVNCLYISADSGATHGFGNPESYVFASRTLHIDSGEYMISYDWRAKLPPTTPTWAFRNCLRAALVPGVASFTAGDNGGWTAASVPSGYISVDSTGGFSGTYDWSFYRQRVRVDSSGTYTLAFLFNYTRYNNYTTTVPPAIDNISIEPVTCPMVDSLTVTAQQAGILLSWDQTSASRWIVDWNGSSTTVDHPYIVVDEIGMGRTDTAYVTPICGTDTGFYEQFAVTQPCDSLWRLPYFQHFDDLDVDLNYEYDFMPYCWNRLVVNDNPDPYTLFVSPSLFNAFGVSGTPGLYWVLGGGTEVQYAVMPPLAERLGPMDSIVVSFEAKRINGSVRCTVGVMSDPYDSTTFVPVSTVYIQNNNFSEHSIPLTGYTGTGRYVAMRVTANGSSIGFQAYSMIMDNIGLSKVSDCRPPVSVVKHPYPDHIDLSWTAGNGENRWIVYCNGVGSGYVLNNQYTISNLQPGTEYSIDIVSNCDNDENSLPRHFLLSTKCEPFGLPYSYGFDSEEFNDCWYMSNDWPRQVNGMLEFWPVPNNYSYAVLPVYPASVDSLELSFSLLQDTIQVGVVDDPYNIGSFVPIRTVAKSRNGEWERFYCYFPNYTGTGRYLAFRSPNTLYTGNINDAYITDVEVCVAPSCPTPDTYRLMARSHNSASFSWHGQGASLFRVDCTPAGGGVPVTVYTQTSTASLTGLEPGTDYDVSIRIVCGAGDTSIALTGSFRTYAAPATVPYICGFDSASAAGWTLVNHTRTNRWYIGSAVYNDSTDHRSLYITNDSGQSNAYSVVSGSTVLAVRNFTLQAGYYNFSYDWRSVGDYNDYLCVALFPDSVPLNDASDFSLIWYINHTPANAIALDDYNEYILNRDGSWHTRTGQVIVPSSGGWNIVFQWRNNNYGGYNPPAAIDNIYLDINSCPPVSDLVYSDVTHNSVTLDWTENGEASSWRVEYGPHGFTPGTGSFHTYFTHPCTLSNLSSSTTYDIYIQPVCADNQFVLYEGPVTVYTDVCEQPDISLFADSSYSDALSTAPVVTYAPYSVSIMLLDSATLGGPRDYEGLRFFYASDVPLTAKDDIDIYMQPTLTEHFAYDTEPLFDSASARLVYSGPFNFSYGWNAVAFDSIYPYLGTGNIMMFIVDNSGGTQQLASFRGYNINTRRGLYYFGFDQPLSPASLTAYECYGLYSMPFLELYSCTPYCAPVAGLAVDTAGYNFATVSWSGDAESYEVTLRSLDDDGEPDVTTTVVGGSHTFTGLAPTSHYRCSVRAVCSSAEGRYSQPMAVDVYSDTLLCTVPSGLTVSEVDYNSAVLDWQPETEEGQWMLHLWNTAKDTNMLVEEHHILLDGLAQGISYNAAVRAYCGGGVYESGESDTVQFTTLVCPPVEDLQVGSITHTSAVATWQSSSTTCDMEYGLHNFGVGQGTLVTGISGGRINIEGLVPGEYYDVNVRAKCADGVTSSWSTVTFQTEAVGIAVAGENSKVVIQPNPASKDAIVTVSGIAGHIEVEVCDLGGRIVQSQSLDCNGNCQAQLNIENLGKGSYFVRIKSNGLNIVQRLVII